MTIYYINVSSPPNKRAWYKTKTLNAPKASKVLVDYPYPVINVYKESKGKYRKHFYLHLWYARICVSSMKVPKAKVDHSRDKVTTELPRK